MKINKYIGIAVCSWLMVACQSDNLDMVQTEQHTLIGQIMNSNVEESRAQIQLGCRNSAIEYFFWNENDRFSLYQQVNNKLTENEFVINDSYSEADGGLQKAEFTSTMALTPLAAYSALYPSPETVAGNQVTLQIQTSVDFSSATTDAQRAEVWKNYFKNNMFMAASGTFSESGRNYVGFNHLCALIRVSYINQTGSEQQISGIRLKGQNLGTGMNYDLVNNAATVNASTSDFKFNTTGLKVADKDTVDVYMLFFPELIEQTDLEISIMQPAGGKTLILPWKDIVKFNSDYESFRAGMRYWFNVTDTANGLDWTKNTYENNLVLFENTELAAALYEMLGQYNVVMTEEGYARISNTYSVYELDFSDYEGEITSLAGIEKFRSLQTLKFNDRGLEIDTLDLSAFSNIRRVEVAGNNIKALKLPASSWNLNYLDCHDNKIQALDITGLGNIEYNGTLICGSQKDNISLNLTLTQNQKNTWESDWINNADNANVTPVVAE